MAEPQILDPISGLKVNVFESPEVVLNSAKKKQSDYRSLLDIRHINDQDGEDLGEMYQRTKVDVDRGLAKEFMDEELLTYGVRQQQAARDVAINTTSTDPDSIARSIEILGNIDVIEERYQDLDGYQQAVIDNNAPESVASFQARRNGVQGRAYQLLEELSEDEGILDKTLDYAALLVPDFIKDVTDVFENGIGGSITDLSRFAKDFQTRDPDEQAVLIEEIVPKLWDAFDGNPHKVGATIGILFNDGGSNSQIGLGVGFDLLAVSDIAAFMKAGKAFAAQRSLATRAVDSEGIDAAARLQAAGGVEDNIIEDAIGVSRVDAAHTANPMPTSSIDEGASLDGLAGEVNVAVNRQIKIIEEELLPISGNKMPRGTMKVVLREKTVLQKQIAQLNLEKQALASSKGSAKVVQGRKRQLAEINEDIALVEEKLAITQERINANILPAQAEADLSRLQQGIVPARFKEQVARAVEEEVQKLRANAEVKKSNPIPTAPVAESAQLKEAVENIGVIIPKRALEVTDRFKRLVDDIAKPAPFTPEEQAYALTKAEERLTKELTESGLSINDMSVVARDDLGFTLKYSTTSGEGERTLKFTRDDNGSLLGVNESKTFKQRWTNMFDKIFSPELNLQYLDGNIVKNVTFAGQQAAKFRNGLANIWKDAEKGLSKQERFEVDSLLMAGDEEAKVYTIAELREGLVETGNGTLKLSDIQIESYYQKRVYFDELHNIRDGLTKRELDIEGYENLSFTAKGATQKLVGRRRKNFDTSDIGIDDVVYFPGEAQEFHSGKMIGFRKKQLKDDGYEVVELLEPFSTKTGKEVTHALVKRESKWGSIPDKVLNYQAGYVPRVYNKGYWYVRDMDTANKEVLYAFPTQDKARAFVDEAGGNLRADPDGGFTAASKLIEDSKAFGGLYTGARKRQPLLVKDGENTYRPDRMSVGNATEKYVQNIASILPLNEYRLTAMERFKNTVDNLAEVHNTSGLVGEKRFDSAIDLPQDSKNVMEQYRQYIKDNMGMPSREERATERMMLGAANMVYGKPWATKPRQWLLDHSQGDVNSWVKGHAFNLHMGWFNARQLFVQMQNASLSISMNPTLALPSMGEALSLRTIALLPEAKAAQAAKHLGYSDDIMESLQQYNKSGLRDSIVRQADFDVNSMGMSHGSMDMAKKLSKAGRTPFNEGENFSRLISWSMSRRKWKLANPKKIIDDKAVQEISEDSLRMQMNLQSENAAWWQKAPVIGLATQFLQVQAKFLENVMPRVLGGGTRWTRQEKIRALTGQMFLYGTVGVPIAEEAVSYASQLTGETPQVFMENNPTFTDSINEGFVGMLASMMGADDLAPTESFSLMAGLDDNVVADIAKGVAAVVNGGYSEEGFVETLSGPSANITRRLGDVVGGLILSVKTLYEVPSLEVAYGAIASNISDIAAMTSTWSNTRKLAVLHATGNLYSSRGTLVATGMELGDLSLPVQLGIAMGFPTDIEQAYYSDKGRLKHNKDFAKSALKDLQRSQIEFQVSGNEELWAAKKAVLLSPFSETEKMNMMDALIDSATNPTSGIGKQVQAGRKFFIESGGRVRQSTAEGILQNEVND